MNFVKLFSRSVKPRVNCGCISSILNQRSFADGPVIDFPDDPTILIPQPKERPNESIDQLRARLVYQSRKRGMLENDLLLATFIGKHVNTFTQKQLQEYDNLINGPSNDWDIYYWVTETKPTPQEYEHGVMAMLKEHCKNLGREPRMRQPDL